MIRTKRGQEVPACQGSGEVAVWWIRVALATALVGVVFGAWVHRQRMLRAMEYNACMHALKTWQDYRRHGIVTQKESTVLLAFSCNYAVVLDGVTNECQVGILWGWAGGEKLLLFVTHDGRVISYGRVSDERYLMCP